MRNKLCIFIFAVLFICAVFASCAKSNDLFGLWESESDGIMLHLRSDNTGNLAIGGTDYEFTYSAEDNELILDFSEDEFEEDAHYKYELSGNSLLLTSDESSVTLIRYSE